MLNTFERKIEVFMIKYARLSACLKGVMKNDE